MGQDTCVSGAGISQIALEDVHTTVPRRVAHSGQSHYTENNGNAEAPTEYSVH